jgi:hypothetical protein
MAAMNVAPFGCKIANGFAPVLGLRETESAALREAHAGLSPVARRDGGRSLQGGGQRTARAHTAFAEAARTAVRVPAR